MKLQDYINNDNELKNADLQGISAIELNGEVQDISIEKRNEDIKVVKVRFAGYDNAETHPMLRNPKNNGWITIRFDYEGGEWFFYDYE